ncbi:hypothetical protein BV898_02323 [Hypsibius exemplaris]|uniref:Uncharacterized protein n=1 Tax=Hypsibius exemplaris TaxID=2072580 RepID=A0A1W0X8X9_HYPEX|nr:hypothetical protein BV898_02323 [Hypsibius exemplaris]
MPRDFLGIQLSLATLSQISVSNPTRAWKETSRLAFFLLAAFEAQFVKQINANFAPVKFFLDNIFRRKWSITEFSNRSWRSPQQNLWTCADRFLVGGCFG